MLSSNKPHIKIYKLSFCIVYHRMSSVLVILGEFLKYVKDVSFKSTRTNVDKKKSK